MKKQTILILSVLICLTSNLFAQQVIGDGALKIGFKKLPAGIQLTSIKYNSYDILDNSADSKIFTLRIGAQSISATNGWNKVLVKSSGSHCVITLAKPKNSKLPAGLKVKLTLDVTGRKSDWDITVNGLNKHALNKIYFPSINITAPGNDNVLIPKYSGVVVKNPRKNGFSSVRTYPRGWASSMQFCAYYNTNYGIYLGTHDPTAAIKDLTFKNNKYNGLLYTNKIYAPNMDMPGNDYKLPGSFRLEMFHGNWYDAAQIYKKWASAKANYWPKATKTRLARQQAIGNIAVWLRYYSLETADTLISELQEFHDFYDVPIGFHWYNWNHSYLDDNYPVYFPERQGMTRVIKAAEKIGKFYFMPYLNGRLFETDLKIYPKLGLPNTAKSKSGSISTSSYLGNQFATMCPTQAPWQNILVDAAKQLTDRIDTNAVYLDQVTAAGPILCMDPKHGHPLGGGSFWRQGYHQMLSKMHKSLPGKAFICTEGCNDYLADVVDGFLTDGWTTNNMVPAFQAVYSGKVQLFGTRFGESEYGKPAMYCRFIQSFINGITPGRYYIWLTPHGADSKLTKAALLGRKLARMRYKLRDFLAFGTMLKPISIDRSKLPTVTTTWKDYARDIPVTLSALQYSFWQSRQHDKAILLFGNVSKSQSLKFKVKLTGSDYGLNGRLKLVKIDENGQYDLAVEDNSFNRTITIKPLEIFAILITPQRVLNLPQ